MSDAATVEGDAKLRLFLALTLPEAVEEVLRAWSAPPLSGGRVPESFHVTLAFLGARPRAELEPIVEALRAAAAAAIPFTLTPVRYRETRPVGMPVLEHPSREATSLAEDAQRRLEKLGVYHREARPWLPH